MLTYRDIDAGKHTIMDLPVAVEGSQITVSAAEVTLAGTTYTLSEDVVIDFGVSEANRQINGWLVQVIETDEITIIWDEMTSEDSPYYFLPDGPYRLLERLLIAVVPGDASDWLAENVSVLVYRIRPLAEE